MAGKEATALKLQEAREDLERQLQTAIRRYDEKTKDPMAFVLNLEGGVGPSDDDVPEAERELRGTVRSLVDAFHRKPIVQETGVRVYQVEAMDSDKDGVFALDVKYEYSADTGMQGGSGLQNLPPSSAGQ